MDAIVIKVRTGGRVVSRSIMASTGINLGGYKEILGLKIGHSESYHGWSEYLDWLKQRGLTGVDYLISDHHQGLVKAIQERFQGALWQRCQAHFTKNILDVTPKALKDEVKANLRTIFTAPDTKTARTLLNAALSLLLIRQHKSKQMLTMRVKVIYLKKLILRKVMKGRSSCSEIQRESAVGGKPARDLQ